MKRTIIVSSPGKLILAGEHSVVYGRRALVTSIGRRLYMKLTEDEQNERLLTIRFHDKNQMETIDLTHLQHSDALETQAVMFVYNHFKSRLSDRSRFELEIHSKIPIGAGLGSSAAFSVCLVACFARLCDEKLDLDQINSLAYQVECLFHGTPSGIDNTISTYGQSLLYSRSAQKHLSFQLDHLAILDTGLPKSTKRMVDLVRQFHQTNPQEAEQIFDEIQHGVDTIIEHPEQIDRIFRRNQDLLVRIGVSIPAIDQIIQILNHHDIPCKITGAGGGGCLIALVQPSIKDQLHEWLKEQSIRSIYFVQAGVEGLREEQSFPLDSNEQS